MKNQNNPKKELALVRFSAVSYIEQLREGNMSLHQALSLASGKCWGSCSYAYSTLEDWYYRYRRDGFSALELKKRRDSGKTKALSLDAREQLVKTRREHPELNIKVLVKHLETQGVLDSGTFSMSSIYRFLAKEGLDQASMKAGLVHLGGAHSTSGPTKRFEFAQANELWMCDMSFGPRIKTSSGKVLNTRLFALIDDCSRIVPHGQYYCSENVECFLDTFKHALQKRGIPAKLYTDQGKIFTCQHLQLVCANIGTRLTHAKPYHAWSKGKIERFFRTAQSDFESPLVLNPVHSLEAINKAFWYWLETDYHQRKHSSLEGDTPTKRFQQRSENIRVLEHGIDLEAHFLKRIERRVRLDATISINGQIWEVPTHLRLHKVQVRYNPFRAFFIKNFL